MSSTQYTAKDNISPDCLRGTRGQWVQYLLDTPWYSDYVQKHDENDCGYILSLDEWVEYTLDNNLLEWDEEDQSNFVELDYRVMSEQEKILIKALEITISASKAEAGITSNSTEKISWEAVSKYADLMKEIIEESGIDGFYELCKIPNLCNIKPSK